MLFLDKTNQSARVSN